MMTLQSACPNRLRRLDVSVAPSVQWVVVAMAAVATEAGFLCWEPVEEAGRTWEMMLLAM
jgi:hypothetical protein